MERLWQERFSLTYQELEAIVGIGPIIEAQLRQADHRRCEGGDFDPCLCMTDPLFAARQLERAERLEAILEVLNKGEALMVSRRMELQRRDFRADYLRVHGPTTSEEWADNY